MILFGGIMVVVFGVLMGELGLCDLMICVVVVVIKWLKELVK